MSLSRRGPREPTPGGLGSYKRERSFSTDHPKKESSSQAVKRSPSLLSRIPKRLLRLVYSYCGSEIVRVYGSILLCVFVYTLTRVADSSTVARVFSAQVLLIVLATAELRGKPLMSKFSSELALAFVFLTPFLQIESATVGAQRLFDSLFKGGDFFAE